MNFKLYTKQVDYIHGEVPWGLHGWLDLIRSKTIASRNVITFKKWQFKHSYLTIMIVQSWKHNWLLNDLSDCFSHIETLSVTRVQPINYLRLSKIQCTIQQVQSNRYNGLPMLFAKDIQPQLVEIYFDSPHNFQFAWTISCSPPQ